MHHCAIDLTGQRFGKLVAIEPTEKRDSSRSIVWRCVCDCGNKCFARSASLRDGHTQSCGCLFDLTGQRFGRLVVLRPTKKRQCGFVVWLCKCSCGKTCEVISQNLQSGNTQSCGCFAREILIKRNTTHGMADTLIYFVWRNMLQRCENPNDKAYKNYGGRGIKVCERWHSFENFYTDVGDPPEGMTLDRYPDNDGNYEPTNFRWASRHEQRLNSRAKSSGPHKQLWFLAFDLNTGNWDEDNNQSEFARKHRLDNANISACLHGKQKIHKGWTFEFLP